VSWWFERAGWGDAQAQSLWGEVSVRRGGAGARGSCRALMDIGKTGNGTRSRTPG